MSCSLWCCIKSEELLKVVHGHVGSQVTVIEHVNIVTSHVMSQITAILSELEDHFSHCKVKYSTSDNMTADI